MMHIGLFLDRDGTINEEVDYLSSPHQVQLIPRAADAIREANDLGVKVIIVSNQSGIARGMFTEDDLGKVNSALLDLLEREHAHIDAHYYCPHYPGGSTPPYNIDCDCRKPNTGMLSRAQKDLHIDLARSFVIGDKISDIQTGNNAGSRSILVLTGHGKKQMDLIREQKLSLEYVARDLYDGVQYIKKLLAKEPSLIS